MPIAEHFLTNMLQDAKEVACGLRDRRNQLGGWGIKVDCGRLRKHLLASESTSSKSSAGLEAFASDSPEVAEASSDNFCWIASYRAGKPVSILILAARAWVG